MHITSIHRKGRSVEYRDPGERLHPNHLPRSVLAQQLADNLRALPLDDMTVDDFRELTTAIRAIVTPITTAIPDDTPAPTTLSDDTRLTGKAAPRQAISDLADKFDAEACAARHREAN